jgi:hypothetical protein
MMYKLRLVKERGAGKIISELQIANCKLSTHLRYLKQNQVIDMVCLSIKA